MRDPWKVRLQPFAVAFAGIIECLDEKTLEELTRLRQDCDRATQTNCWCYTWQVAQFLKRKLDRRIVEKLNKKQARDEKE